MFFYLLSNCSIHNVNGGEERRGRQIKYNHNTFASSNCSTLYKWSSKKIKTCAEQPLSAAQSESRQNLAQSENHDSNQPKLWSLSGGILGVFDILIKIRSFLKMLILKYWKYWYQKDILENIKIFWWNIDINCRYIRMFWNINKILTFVAGHRIHMRRSSFFWVVFFSHFSFAFSCDQSWQGRIIHQKSFQM